MALAVIALAVLLYTSMAAPPHRSGVTLEEEAQHIALDASDHDLLPNLVLVEKIMIAVPAIRSQQPAVAKVRNTGRWKLGEVKIENLKQSVTDEIKKSDFGPVIETITGKDEFTTIVFKKPYNPDLLAEELHTKYGVVAQGVWKDNSEPDLGSVSYSQEDNTYTFREGLANCGSNCTANNFWVYKIDSNNKSTLDHQYATDIPLQYVHTD